MHSDPRPLQPRPHQTCAESAPATPTDLATPTLDKENTSFLLDLFDQFTRLVLVDGAPLLACAHATPLPTEQYTWLHQGEGPGKSHDQHSRSHDQRVGQEYVAEVYPLDFVEV